MECKVDKEGMFRSTIRQAIDARGWTIYRLIKESGISKSSVYGFMNGEREIESDKLEQLCKVLNLSLQEGKS